MIHVTPRARIHTDRAGDPLDGLVNLFDIGIVLAVAFLLAALSSLGLSGAVSKTGLTKPANGEVQIKPGETVKDVPTKGSKTVGRGTPVGTVYRLADGRLVYVTSDGTTTTDPSAQPSAPQPSVPQPTADQPSANPGDDQFTPNPVPTVPLTQP